MSKQAPMNAKDTNSVNGEALFVIPNEVEESLTFQNEQESEMFRLRCTSFRSAQHKQ
jgi:hypothetical protein